MTYLSKINREKGAFYIPYLRNQFTRLPAFRDYIQNPPSTKKIISLLATISVE